MTDWNDISKRILKAELIRRGISNAQLAMLISAEGGEETKSSIDSKISRGTFSAAFFLHCLTVIGCEKLDIEIFENKALMVAEGNSKYNVKK